MEKLREAKEKQIRFISDFHYPGDTKLNAFDLSVILNNALDNCMENVSGENPYISISSFRKNSIFMITIKNRYEGELNYKDSDLPETTKSGKEHGIDCIISEGCKDVYGRYIFRAGESGSGSKYYVTGKKKTKQNPYKFFKIS